MSGQGSGDERGSTELAIATPLLLLVILLVAQVAVWAHGQHTATTIAEHGLATTRAADGDAAQGQAQAEQVADQLSGQVLTDITISAQRETTNATVQVEATVPSLIPGTRWPVSTQRDSPVERLPEAEPEAVP